MRVEVKSIVEGGGVRLSSIEGWTENHLPKVLVVVECRKVKMTPIVRPDGRQTKARDIEVEILGYDIYYFPDASPDVFVPWPGIPSLREVTATRWRQSPQFLQMLRDTARIANLQSQAPVKLQAEKNGELCRIHYVCADHRRLPPCPPELRAALDPTLQELVGSRLLLWKDHSAVGGRVGYVDEAMLHWEDRHRLKASGRLDVLLPTGEVREYPEFRQGRQDYWGGFAIEVVLEALSERLTRTSGGTPGADLTIDDLLSPDAAVIVSTEQLRELAQDEGKHGLLRRIQAELDVTPRASDVSRGGTVTRTALMEIARQVYALVGLPEPQVATKADCIRVCLDALGAPTEVSDVSRGGTVTAYALLKILLGLDRLAHGPNPTG